VIMPESQREAIAKRNPGRGNAGVSQLATSCSGEVAHLPKVLYSYLSYNLTFRSTTRRILPVFVRNRQQTPTLVCPC